MPQRPPDWQLPPGITPGLWDYLHQEDLAAGYLDSIASSPVINVDVPWVARHLPERGLILDLGCGPGRSLIPIARQGLNCVGVDLSEPMLRQAAANAQQAGAHIDWVRANLVELACLRDECADVVLCMFSTLGMIQPTAAREKVLGHVHRLLKANSRLLLHVHNRWFQRRQQGTWPFLKEVLASLIPGMKSKDEPMPIHQGVAGLQIHAFTRREITRLLHRHGFSVKEVTMLGLTVHGHLPRPWLLPGLRAHGYLIAARKR